MDVIPTGRKEDRWKQQVYGDYAAMSGGSLRILLFMMQNFDSFVPEISRLIFRLFDFYVRHFLLYLRSG